MKRRQIERAAELYGRIDEIRNSLKAANKRGQDIFYLAIGEDDTVILDRQQTLRLLDLLMGETRAELNKLEAP